jgi:hypothetical protein
MPIYHPMSPVQETNFPTGERQYVLSPVGRIGTMSRAKYSWRVALQQSPLPLPWHHQYAKPQPAVPNRFQRTVNLLLCPLSHSRGSPQAKSHRLGLRSWGIGMLLAITSFFPCGGDFGLDVFGGKSNHHVYSKRYEGKNAPDELECRYPEPDRPGWLLRILL